MKSAMTHTPIFLAGTNLGQRFGSGQTKGGDTALMYDTDLQCLIIKYKGTYAMVPLATIENMQPSNPKIFDSYFAPQGAGTEIETGN
jgi:hypothetical protein